MNLKQTIAIILLLALAMICVYTFCDSSGDPPPEKTIPADTIRKEADVITKQYSEQVSRLAKENDSLKLEIARHKKALMLSRQEVIASESKVSRIEVREKTVRDTVLKLVYCDSLSEQVDSLVSCLNKRDSVCEQVSLELTKQVQNRDSVIASCQRSLTDLKSVTDSSVSQQKVLEDELAKAGKKLKRRAVMNRLFSAGLLVLSGVAASTLLIHH